MLLIKTCERAGKEVYFEVLSTSGLVQSHDIAVLGQNMALLNGILKSIQGGLAFYACLSTLSIWELSKKCTIELKPNAGRDREFKP